MIFPLAEITKFEFIHLCLQQSDIPLYTWGRVSGRHDGKIQQYNYIPCWMPPIRPHYMNVHSSHYNCIINQLGHSPLTRSPLQTTVNHHPCAVNSNSSPSLRYASPGFTHNATCNKICTGFNTLRFNWLTFYNVLTSTYNVPGLAWRKLEAATFISKISLLPSDCYPCSINDHVILLAKLSNLTDSPRHCYIERGSTPCTY